MEGRMPIHKLNGTDGVGARMSDANIAHLIKESAGVFKSGLQFGTDYVNAQTQQSIAKHNARMADLNREGADLQAQLYALRRGQGAAPQYQHGAPQYPHRMNMGMQTNRMLLIGGGLLIGGLVLALALKKK